ncbi:MAG: hypothetical protein Tsb0010_08680 [Parvularculaceae bacterium]
MIKALNIQGGRIPKLPQTASESPHAPDRNRHGECCDGAMAAGGRDAAPSYDREILQADPARFSPRAAAALCGATPQGADGSP